MHPQTDWLICLTVASIHSRHMQLLIMPNFLGIIPVSSHAGLEVLQRQRPLLATVHSCTKGQAPPRLVSHRLTHIVLSACRQVVVLWCEDLFIAAHYCCCLQA